MAGFDEEIRAALARWGDIDANEIYEIRTYEGYRRQRKVKIDVMYAGPAGGPYRWNASVMDCEDGRTVSGNGAENIDEALAIVHWNELDSPPP